MLLTPRCQANRTRLAGEEGPNGGGFKCKQDLVFVYLEVGVERSVLLYQTAARNTFARTHGQKSRLKFEVPTRRQSGEGKVLVFIVFSHFEPIFILRS